MDVTDRLDYSRYTIRSNAGKGDCLFHAVRQALKTIGLKATVEDLRRHVAESVTEDQFETMRAIFKGAAAEKDHEVLRDYGWIAGARTIEDLRAKMMSSNYFGDELAVAALENRLKLRLVVMQFRDDRYFLAVHPNPGLVDESGYVLLRHDLDARHYELMLYDRKGVLDALPREMRS